MSERARAKIDTFAITSQLSQIPTGDSLQANPALAETARALQAQLDTAKRIDEEVASTYEGLVLLNARLGEVVASVIELSARPGGLTDVVAVDADVESVVNELAALRQAISEVDGRHT